MGGVLEVYWSGFTARKSFFGESGLLATTALIIDDSESVRRRVQQAFESERLFDTILMASNGIEAFKMLMSQQVDIILCDLNMPGIDGFKFLALKQSRPEYGEVPVIMLTGEEDVKSKVRGLEAGASDYLTKPFHDEELLARVKVHLKIKALQGELRDKNSRLESISRTDELTGVNNRRFFMEALRLEFDRSQRYATALGFGMVDIDHFKRINDTYGHLVGDQALVAVAQFLRKAMRNNDVLGRIGGEEFAILMPHTEQVGCTHALERWRQQIEGLAIDADGVAVHVTVSIGAVCCPRDGIDRPEHLIALADEALYKAKESGRNRVIFST